MKRPTLAVAHRGLSVEEPENTLAAFRAAAKAHAHGIELDVRLTHDGHVVVMHDENIARTSDGVGRVNDFDLAELQSHLTADGPIPTLREVLEDLAFWDGVWNIEIKATAATPKTLELIDEAGIGDRVIITSMDPAALEMVQQSHPSVGRGLIVLGPPDEDDTAAAQETGSDWLMVNHEYIDAKLVQSCYEAGHRVGAWTVNDVDEARDLVAAGVHMVMTDERNVLESLL